MVDLFGALLSSYIVKVFKRKTLLVWGNFGIALCHVLIGFAVLYGNINMAFFMIISFELIFVNTSGPVAWIYANETVTDTGLGICLLFLWITLFTLSLISPALMAPESMIGPSNYFFILSGICLFATIYS